MRMERKSAPVMERCRGFEAGKTMLFSITGCGKGQRGLQEVVIETRPELLTKGHLDVSICFMSQGEPVEEF